jgi:hypothetical protein
MTSTNHALITPRLVRWARERAQAKRCQVPFSALLRIVLFGPNRATAFDAHLAALYAVRNFVPRGHSQCLLLTAKRFLHLFPFPNLYRHM